MAERLAGKPVSEKLNAEIIEKVARLKEAGIAPKLVLLRVGENADDISYERSAKIRADKLGIIAESKVLPVDTSKQALIEAIQALNEDKSVHGVLMFRPLPKTLRACEQEICDMLSVAKDVDGMTTLSCAYTYLDGAGEGFLPCTAQACLELMDYYHIETEGKRVAVIGRSNVIGKPLALQLMSKRRNATVTVCHTRTRNIAEITRSADILITAAGAAGSINAESVREGQIILDVAVNVVEGKLVGDVMWDEVEPIVAACTPVPGGIGGITTAVLMAHVVEAATK